MLSLHTMFPSIVVCLSLSPVCLFTSLFASLALQGKGIVHAEMPTGPDRGHGLQLWVNLKSGDKMVPPAYQVGTEYTRTILNLGTLISGRNDSSTLNTIRSMDVDVFRRWWKLLTSSSENEDAFS